MNIFAIRIMFTFAVILLIRQWVKTFQYQRSLVPMKGLGCGLRFLGFAN